MQTINIGDMVQVWSNDRYVAPLHRVLATREADRYSAPFFYNPPHTATIAPAPGEQNVELGAAAWSVAPAAAHLGAGQELAAARAALCLAQAKCHRRAAR